ncbi:MAG: aldehyde dehydrogenase [Atopostipes sp.]|nr:aldehyde dehydrogenase [Atopostipes sp.]
MIEEIIKDQKTFFGSNITKDLAFRLKHLRKLADLVEKKEAEIVEALSADLGKSYFEAYSSEIGYILESIHYTMKNLKKWAKPKRKRSPLFMPISKSKIHYEPHGIVLIIGPFNYPFQLVLEPLVGAIAAGNTCILKPSEKTPNTSRIIKEMMAEVFEKDYVTVVEGGKELVTELIHAPVNYIFFTGSNKVGKIIMEAASKRLIPVTLELGGKSPTIVHKDADLEKAAARIVWGKFYNVGQTCIAPDYIYAHESIKEELLEKMKTKIADFYGENPLESPDYGKIIDESSFDRLVSLIEEEKVVAGGQKDRDTLKMAPTLLNHIDWQDPVMQEEIFGPILPVLSYHNLEHTLEIIKDQPRPLAFYLFTENKDLQKEVINKIPFGGGCINDTLSHVTSPRLPFGGTGNSGMGSYHGKESFLTFSHKKSIMKKSTLFDIKTIYPPYKGKLGLLKKIMK